MKTDYNDLLYQKIKKEYDAFVEELETRPPKEIILHSYKKVFKEDIMMCFEDISLEQKEVKALFKKQKNLDLVYNKWLFCDRSYMDMLRNTIDDSCKIAVRDMKALLRGER